MQRVNNRIYLYRVQTNTVDVFQHERGSGAAKVRHPHRRIDPERAYQQVLAIVRLYAERKHPCVAVEDVAYELGLRRGQVQQVFQRLNREGVLSRRSHSFAHDTDRNPLFPGRDSGWCSNYYTILRTP